MASVQEDNLNFTTDDPDAVRSTKHTPKPSCGTTGQDKAALHFWMTTHQRGRRCEQPSREKRRSNNLRDQNVDTKSVAPFLPSGIELEDPQQTLQANFVNYYDLRQSKPRKRWKPYKTIRTAGELNGVLGYQQDILLSEQGEDDGVSVMAISQVSTSSMSDSHVIGEHGQTMKQRWNNCKLGCSLLPDFIWTREWKRRPFRSRTIHDRSARTVQDWWKGFKSRCLASINKRKKIETDEGIEMRSIS